MSTQNNRPANVDAQTVNTIEDGVVDVGDEQYVSPVMQAVLAGDPVIFDMGVGELPYAGPEPEVS